MALNGTGGINCKNGCKALPKPGTGCPNNCPTGGAVCDFNGMFRFNANGTITTGMDLSCVTVTEAPSVGSAVTMTPCDGAESAVLWRQLSAEIRSFAQAGSGRL
jgi:hypothetical protein